MRSDPAEQIELLKADLATAIAGDDTQIPLNISVGLTGTLLAAGRDAEAFEAALLLMDSDFGAAWKTWGVTAGLPAAAWAGDEAGLARCEDALAQATGRWPQALRTWIAAVRAGLAGDRSTSLARYRDTFGRLRELGTPLPLAASVISACRQLGPLPELAPAIAEARAILLELRAAPFLERLEEAVSGGVPVPAEPSVKAPAADPPVTSPPS